MLVWKQNSIFHSCVHQGLGFLDYNDGWPDILQVDGHVYPSIDQHNLGQTFMEPRVVYRNLGNGKFQDVSKAMGSGITARHSSLGWIWSGRGTTLIPRRS